MKFKYIIPAKKARHALAGRTYNKRIVFASFYPEERYEMKDYLVNYWERNCLLGRVLCLNLCLNIIFKIIFDLGGRIQVDFFKDFENLI